MAGYSWTLSTVILLTNCRINKSVNLNVLIVNGIVLSSHSIFILNVLVSWAEVAYFDWILNKDLV